MEIKIHNIPGCPVAEIISKNVIMSGVQDALDIMAEADNLGARKIILSEENISPEFFDLRTGLAGEILQKFVNYGFGMAIAGDFEKYGSKNFKSFIYECNKGSRFLFCRNINEALEKLSGTQTINQKND